jgi:hypothetical protein
VVIENVAQQPLDLAAPLQQAIELARANEWQAPLATSPTNTQARSFL